MNRRHLLGLLAGATLAPLSAASARRFSGTLNPGVIGPGAGWTGTGGSGYGGSPPPDPTRTTAKPAAQWLVPDKQVLSANDWIGVDADALGGMLSVQLFVEGNTQTILAPTIRSYTDANGNSRLAFGFWFQLDAASAIAAHNGGVLNLYAKATANDGTMQSRVLGPLTVTVNSTQYDHTYTIGPSTGTFANLHDAVAQMITDGAARPHFRFTDSGSYEAQTSQSTYTSTTGYMLFDAAPGVTATLIRGASFDPLNSTGIGGAKAWEWWPCCDQIRFRGSGIVLDLHNWNNIHAVDATRPYWFDGCQIVNSANARDVYYWNGSPPPGFVPNLFSGTLVPCWVQDCTIKYVDLYTSGVVTGLNNAAIGMLTGDHSELHYAQGNYETQSDPRTFSTLRNAISVTYSGGSTATIVTTVVANTLDCKVNGSSVGGVFPITLGNSPAATYFTMSNVAAAISAISGGAWSATVVDNNLACWALSQASTATTYTITATATNLQAAIDQHTEWSHTQTVNCENIIYRNNTVRRAYFTTNILNGQHAVQDAILKGNVWECIAQDIQNGGWAGSHVVVDNNLLDAPFAVYPDTNYSQFSRNVLSGVGFGSSSGLSSMPASWTYNVTVSPWPAGADASNQTAANYAALSALFTDKTNGDFRPSGTMPTAARLDLYDGRNNARAATDAFGPWALGYSAPSYPF